MIDSESVRREIREAQTLLKGMGALSPSSRLGVVGERAAQLFAIFDAMVAPLTESASDESVEQLERVLDLLHEVDKKWPDCGDTEAVRLLDLVATRLRRIGR